MASFSSCAGLPVVGGSLLVPLVGAWTADLYLATSEPVSGAVPVVVGNLTLHGFVYRSEAYGGQTRARLVGGAGGWRNEVDGQGYGSGVKLSHALGDVASACGETVAVAADQDLPAYTRASGPASDVLWQLLAQGYISAWHVDPAGTTQASPWPTVPVSSSFTVTDQKPDEGLIVVATEDYAAWLPGCTFTAPQLSGTHTSAGVNYVWDNDGTFRLEVLTGKADRFLGALQAFIARQLAPLRFHGRYGYTITAATETTVDGTPIDQGAGLPDLQNVPITADSIAAFIPSAGSECHIMFRDGVPTRPICVWCAEAPILVQLASGATPVARIGDTVQAMIAITPPNLTGTLSLGVSGPMVQGVPYPINPLASSLVCLVPVTGTVTTGSGKVQTQ